jgi:hypothetical protein
MHHSRQTLQREEWTLKITEQEVDFNPKAAYVKLMKMVHNYIFSGPQTEWQTNRPWTSHSFSKDLLKSVFTGDHLSPRDAAVDRQLPSYSWYSTQWDKNNQVNEWGCLLCYLGMCQMTEGRPCWRRALWYFKQGLNKKMPIESRPKESTGKCGHQLSEQ